MNVEYDTADASAYCRDVTSTDIARMDSSAACGNLADAMKNATVLFPPPHVDEAVQLSTSTIFDD